MLQTTLRQARTARNITTIMQQAPAMWSAVAIAAAAAPAGSVASRTLRIAAASAARLQPLQSRTSDAVSLSRACSPMYSVAAFSTVSTPAATPAPTPSASAPVTDDKEGQLRFCNMLQLRRLVKLSEAGVCAPSLTSCMCVRPWLASTVHMVMYGDGFERVVSGREGETLLDVANFNEVDQIEGACEGCMCCSTCHMVFDPATFAALGPVPDDEQDVIDRAAGVTDTSRLGCQVRVTKALEGKRVRKRDTLRAACRQQKTGGRNPVLIACSRISYCCCGRLCPDPHPF
jgi:2Fe-2S ferredoxin